MFDLMSDALAEAMEEDKQTEHRTATWDMETTSPESIPTKEASEMSADRHPVEEQTSQEQIAALNAIAKVTDECGRTETELDQMVSQRERLIQRCVLERLGHIFDAELQLNLAMGVHRNKVGTLVSQLCRLFEKLDAVLSHGNETIIKARKDAVKHVEKVLKRADAMFAKANRWVAFATRLHDSPRQLRRNLPKSQPELPESSATPKEDEASNPDEETSSRKHESSALNPALRYLQQLQKAQRRAKEQSSPQETEPVRIRFPAPKYQIEDHPDEVTIVMRLPRGFQEEDLKFDVRDSSILVVEGFENPLEFAVDERKMNLKKTTYRISKDRVLRIEIPRRQIMTRPQPVYRSARPASYFPEHPGFRFAAEPQPFGWW